MALCPEAAFRDSLDDGDFSATSRGVMTFSEQENAGIEWDQDKEHI